MTRRRRALFATLVAALVAAYAAPANAADVGIVATPPNEPLVARLVLELEQLGFVVAHEVGLRADAHEAILLRYEGGRFDLFEVQPDGSLTKREWQTVATDPIKIAEEVRALLLPLVKGDPPRSSQDDAGPTTAAPELAPASSSDKMSASPTPKSIEASIGAGPIFGGATPGVVVGLGLAVFPSTFRAGRAAIGLGLDATLPVVAEQVTRVQGSSSVRAFTGGPEVIGRIELVPNALIADLALGLRVNHVWFRGEAKAPFTSQSDSAWTWSPAARARLQYRLGVVVGVFIDARAGISLPEIAVRYAGGTTSAWGMPWMSASAGAAFAF